MDVQVVELVLALQLLGVLNAGCAEIDAGDVSGRPANGIFCGLRGAAAGNEYRVVLAVRSRGPEEMKISPAPFALLPTPPIGIEVIDGRGIRIPLVEGLYFHRRTLTVASQLCTDNSTESVSFARCVRAQHFRPFPAGRTPRGEL